MPGFSMMGFVSAIEPLRVANRFRPGAYRWQLLSTDGAAVSASNGMSLNVDGDPGPPSSQGWLIVVAGFEPLAACTPALGAWLRATQRAGALLGAVDTGAFVLAEAGVVGAGPITLHWEAQAAFSERYPRIMVSRELFEIGDHCITCAGGTAAIDMMLARIAERHGRDLAVQVSEQFVLGRIRSASDHQQLEITTRYQVHNTKLVQVIALMQNHIEDPLAPEDLARMIGVTRRQLERLFAAHLSDTPLHFYSGLRLAHARTLLQQSGMGIAAVALACGFESPSHFSRSYRGLFGRSPTQERAAPRRSGVVAGRVTSEAG
ncbi:GlxA family transcriptional regulator [Comamonadaceae bacterium G21597-S1]|nr:GlxA family transcriptional regulator [Comamonadaceae bacterium G21597-S1]